MSLRLLRDDEPFNEARENVDLRRTLARLTLGTHDRQRGFVLLPNEAQALFNALAHRTFSPHQLATAVAMIRSLDPDEQDSDWDSYHLELFAQAARRLVDHPQWIDGAVRHLHVAMRTQGPGMRFRLALCRAVLVVFLTIDLLPQPEELLGLTG